MEPSGWYGVRCIFALSQGSDDVRYEERVTVWRAPTVDDALTLAEADAVEYAHAIDADYLGLAQAYTMSDELTAGAEVFSLLRTSPLPPSEYLDRHFDTGTERQTRF